MQLWDLDKNWGRLLLPSTKPYYTDFDLSGPSKKSSLWILLVKALMEYLAEMMKHTAQFSFQWVLK
jgi:hypothetical protein